MPGEYKALVEHIESYSPSHFSKEDEYARKFLTCLTAVLQNKNENALLLKNSTILSKIILFSKMDFLWQNSMLMMETDIVTLRFLAGFAKHKQISRYAEWMGKDMKDPESPKKADDSVKNKTNDVNDAFLRGVDIIDDQYLNDFKRRLPPLNTGNSDLPDGSIVMVSKQESTVGQSRASRPGQASGLTSGLGAGAGPYRGAEPVAASCPHSGSYSVAESGPYPGPGPGPGEVPAPQPFLPLMQATAQQPQRQRSIPPGFGPVPLHQHQAPIAAAAYLLAPSPLSAFHVFRGPLAAIPQTAIPISPVAPANEISILTIPIQLVSPLHAQQQLNGPQHYGLPQPPPAPQPQPALQPQLAPQLQPVMHQYAPQQPFNGLHYGPQPQPLNGLEPYGPQPNGLQPYALQLHSAAAQSKKRTHKKGNFFYRAVTKL